MESSGVNHQTSDTVNVNTEVHNSIGNMKTKMEFAVQMNSLSCVDKVTQIINEFGGVQLLSIDLKSQKLVVEGSIMADSVKNRIEEKTGMSTVLLGHSTGQNLGAGVAAIQVGNHGVKGLLRLVQSNQNNCIIEGTVDSVPVTKPVFVTLHETGNISAGCESCGNLLTSDQGFDGILSQLSPNDNQRAEFRVHKSGLNLSNVIGRCVVVHEGAKEEVLQGKSVRLACGIVARASGMFQNSKRFCACDGRTIWQERELEKAGKL